ncbi:uncharacterized protein BCR38DRAFT_414263 [Pseudomassariella vexata]|uniref:Uncharacterized protein n=1 Tax=Pseudomassariella vexata TaxID=1141098 RepID=A0A1Y2DCG5_9PEZI|nr:uncharacterized protein BCR38DRAFT_414263 [Pseudomassariella vexata]ORY56951.1 hypothetical protein BCR38DRAFT_414263 [Pseudomassariella vexata]
MLRKISALRKKGSNDDRRPQGQSRSKSTDAGPRQKSTDPGPLGLNVVYCPSNGHKADIVFVHGLGGSMLDFAKDLLFDLKYARDGQGQELDIGHVPLIFVAHSMGGLIVKEAYMQGQNDPEYESIIKAISAITFLATPHRGTNLANTLNRILQSTFVTNSKQYISELTRSSFTLQKLNEQFRHIAPRLDIISFYATQPTSLGLKSARVMVLEKDSSVLGYPGETSKALNADHHGVCKYDCPEDPNYITVRNALKSLLSKIISSNPTSSRSKGLVSNRKQSHDLKSVLAITELPSIDYSFFRDQWVEGTGDWILQNETYLEWLHSQDPSPRLLWLTGGAASGKSVLSSFIINSLVKEDACCQYFFIRFGDRKKRTLSLILRSIAYQIALSVPGFLQNVIQLAEEAIGFETADSRTIWDCVIKTALSSTEIRKPLFWVIDGLDEADDPRAILKQLSDISSLSLPVRILLELNMPGDAGFKEDLVQRIVDGAQNNFLWVRLAVDKLNMCYTQPDVERALRELPVGMEALYDRMASSIAQTPTPTDRKLASTILQCVTCSLRMLTVAELSQALEEDVLEVIDLQRTILDLCGGFVLVDNGANVAMIHQTAREDLLNSSGGPRPFHVDREEGHKQMFLSCMRCLMAPALRSKIIRDQMPEFLEYAANFWSFHLIAAPVDCSETAEAVKKFLKGHWVLTWIHILAYSNRLGVLVRTSKHLSRYSAERRAHEVSGAQIAVLVSSGSVFLYDSSTLDETASSPFKHGERVYRMQLNSTGTVIVTYGYRTTKVWEVSTGNCTLSVANIETGLRPLVLLLKNNSTLLVGTDDRRIRSLQLTHPSPAWNLVAELEEPELEGHFLNAASQISLNKDGTLITVAYRGHPLSAWETDGPVHIGHCWRKDAEYPGEVVEAVWHPHFPQILGLYTTGQIFKWGPYDGELDELPVGANRLTINRDGNLFATGDVHGTVKVYTTSSLSLLYHLASQDTVLGLAFSPDLRRLYDIRGYYGNAWEPNALLRYAEQAGKGSDSDSETESLTLSSRVPVNTPKWIDPITVLAVSPTERLYCCGTEKGTVVLHDTKRGGITEIHTSKNHFSIGQMTWSPDGRFLCFSDSSRKIFITSIRPGASNSDPVVGPQKILPMQSSTKGPILQLLFQSDASHVLVHTASMVLTISIASFSVTNSIKLQTAECKWIIHPQDPGLVIGFASKTAHILDWNLVERQNYKLDYPLYHNGPPGPGIPSDQASLDRVLVTHDKRHVLVQISPLSHKTREKKFLYFDTSSFSAATTVTSDKDQKSVPATITPSLLPQNASSRIALAIAFLPNNRLIFLSRTFQICSWQVSTSSDPPGVPLPISRAWSSATLVHQQGKNDPHSLGTEIFALPGDWISRECLVLCNVWGKERSLLCPTNGDVAIVRSSSLV